MKMKHNPDDAGECSHKTAAQSRQEHWIKLWSRWFFGESHYDISPAELGVATFALMMARWHVRPDESAVVATKAGKPLNRESYLAEALKGRRPHLAERRLVLDALEKLLEVGTLIEEGDEKWLVVPNFVAWQESQHPSAQRMKRARQRSVTGDVTRASRVRHSERHSERHTVTPRVTERREVNSFGVNRTNTFGVGEREPRLPPLKRTTRSRPPPQNPASTTTFDAERDAGVLPGVDEGAPENRAQDGAQEVDPSALSGAFVSEICKLVTEAVRTLPGNEQARAIRDSDTNRKFIAHAVRKFGTTLADWQHVVEAQRRDVLRQGPEHYRWLRLQTICGHTTFQSLLDAPMPPIPKPKQGAFDRAPVERCNPLNLPTGTENLKTEK
jgi:hypothetical protein